MARLGKRQLKLLAGLGSPFTLLVVGDKLSASLVKRGLLTATASEPRDALFRITPAGLRELANALERGDLEQFVDERFAGGKS